MAHYRHVQPGHIEVLFKLAEIRVRQPNRIISLPTDRQTAEIYACHYLHDARGEDVCRDDSPARIREAGEHIDHFFAGGLEDERSASGTRG